MAVQWYDQLVKFLCGLVLIGAVALGSPTVSAQEVDVAKVLGLIGEANEHFEKETYDKALVAYEEAYGLLPDPSLLYRMGVSAEKLNKISEAVGYYEGFVDAVPDDPTAKLVRDRLAELKELIPSQILLETVPAGANVYLDSMESESLGQTPLEVEFPVGRSVVFFQLEGYENEVRNIDAVKGEKRQMSVELTKTRPVVLVETEETPPPVSEGSNLTTWGWIAAGAGTAILLTGGVFTFLSSSATDDANTYDKRAPGASQAELNSIKDDALFYYDTSVILYVTGGVLAATGVTLLVLDSMKGGRASLNVSPAADGAWVSLQGAF